MLKNSYIRIKGQKFEPIYVPNEIYAFYMNFDKPITDPDFANFRLNLVRENVQISLNLGTLQKDMVSAVAYNIYCEFIFPFVANGCYQFQIYDIVKNVEKCRSNCICVEGQFYLENTVLFHYRNFRSIYNFNYDTMPVDFLNKFRLPLNQVDFQYESDRKQYRNASNNELRNQYSFLNKFIKIESYYFDEQAHDAIAAAYEQSINIIDGRKYEIKDAYQVETNQNSLTTKGSVNAYEQDVIFEPQYPDQTIYVLAVDDSIAITDGNDNLISI